MRWTPPILSAAGPVAPMTRDESEMFLNFAIQGNRDPVFIGADALAAKIGLQAPFPLRILAGRLLMAEPKPRIGEGVVLFCAALCDTPGKCVLWAWTLANRWHVLAPSRGADFVYRICDLAEDFPWGFPTAAQYDAIWNAQKGDAPLGNLLDRADTWRLNGGGAP